MPLLFANIRLLCLLASLQLANSQGKLTGVYIPANVKWERLYFGKDFTFYHKVFKAIYFNSLDSIYVFKSVNEKYNGKDSILLAVENLQIFLYRRASTTDTLKCMGAIVFNDSLNNVELDTSGEVFGPCWLQVLRVKKGDIWLDGVKYTHLDKYMFNDAMSPFFRKLGF